jgi:hypothetical protein
MSELSPLCAPKRTSAGFDLGPPATDGRHEGVGDLDGDPGADLPRQLLGQIDARPIEHQRDLFVILAGKRMRQLGNSVGEAQAANGLMP